jgi:arylsulfatase
MNQYDLLFLLFTSVQCNSLPNFLILFPDQWRSDWSGGFEGLPSLHMPFFESLANNGTRFRNAFVPSPLCAPSRACLAAGREYDLAGVPDNFSNDYPLSIPTFYQLLEKAGYFVMTSGKDDLTKSSGPGIDGQYHAKELGFSNFARTEGKEDVLKSNKPTDPYGNFCLQHNISTNEGNISLWDVLLKKDSDCCSNVKGSSSGYFCEIPSIIPQFAYEDDFVTDLSITMLETKPKTVPWLLQVSFPGPHPPFIVTSSMRNLTLTEDYPPAVDNTILSQKDGLDIKRLYAAELEHIDTSFQRIVNKVVDIGDIDNTIVIISSDHGEMLGDHMDWGKTLPWQGSISVPLVVTGPGLGIKNQVISGLPVATMDITGTILDLTGISPVLNMTTQSFKQILYGLPKSSYPRQYVSSGLASWRAVMKEDSERLWKLICCHGECPGSPSTVASGIRSYIGDEWKHNPVIQGNNGDESTGREHDLVKTGNTTILLYDVMTDSADMTNLANEFPDIVNELKELLPKGFCQ